MKAYLGLGSNLGDRLQQLETAIDLLNQQTNITVTKRSHLYETKPYGDVPQDNYYNAVVEIETELPPLELLATVNQIEHQLKRERTIRWGPRTMDIDILLMDGIDMDSEKLTIPHKELTKRSFVLVPLKEVYPDSALLGQTIDEWIAQSGNEQDVIRQMESW